LIFHNPVIELFHISGNVNNLKSDCQNKSISKRFLTYSILKSDIDFPNCLMPDDLSLNQEASSKRGCRNDQFDLIKKHNIEYSKRIPIFGLLIYILSIIIIVKSIFIERQDYY